MTCPTHYTIRQAKRYEAQGESLTLAEWAKRAGVSRQTFRRRFFWRLDNGWSIEDAIITPTGRAVGAKVRTGLKPGRLRK